MSDHVIWLAAIREKFVADKRMAESAIAQLSDDEVRRRPADGFNSVATIVRHVGGNLLGRWTDFLTTDGDKPTRDREGEFADWPGSRAALMAAWDDGFAAVLAALDALTPADVARTVTIRGQPHTVPQAVVRSLDHTAYHVGQILYVARLVHAGPWDYLTVPPGGSAAFNARMAAKAARDAPER